ncbi:MAG: hypothetical protein KF889_19295 [Alphaproteobacteria bacterium]|nr:hypothetical protein [Alphaproteobacteria bacterium]MCW5744079.1 hypothetical protein [Alphaproteobacteria bacterium]
MSFRVAAIVLAALLAAGPMRPAAAQTDWRMTLGVLYAISYAIPACGVKASPEQLRRLERGIAHAEGKVGMSRAELQEIRRKGDIEARKDSMRICDTMGREALRLIDELPDRLPD